MLITDPPATAGGTDSGPGAIRYFRQSLLFTRFLAWFEFWSENNSAQIGQAIP